MFANIFFEDARTIVQSDFLFSWESEDRGIFEKTNIQKRQHPKPVPTYTFIRMNQLKWVLSNFNFNRELCRFHRVSI